MNTSFWFNSLKNSKKVIRRLPVHLTIRSRNMHNLTWTWFTQYTQCCRSSISVHCWKMWWQTLPIRGIPLIKHFTKSLTTDYLFPFEHRVWFGKKLLSRKSCFTWFNWIFTLHLDPIMNRRDRWRLSGFKITRFFFISTAIFLPRLRCCLAKVKFSEKLPYPSLPKVFNDIVTGKWPTGRPLWYLI